MLFKHRDRLRLAILEDLKIFLLRPGTGSALLMVTTISSTTSRTRFFSVGVGTTGGFRDWADAAIAVLAKNRKVLRKKHFALPDPEPYQTQTVCGAGTPRMPTTDTFSPGNSKRRSSWHDFI